ncbi:hypothetical protein Tco_1479545 [Tanacetum coccineum]
MEERYAKFIDLIKEVRTRVPLIDVLAGMPNYEKFLKDLMSNKSKMEQMSSAFLNEECFHQPDAIFTIRFTLWKHLETYKDEYSLSQSYLPIPDGSCGEHAHLSWEIHIAGRFCYPTNGEG